jgi:pimeloyl-[acyl-carrier protein] methyl ester esterase
MQEKNSLDRNGAKVGFIFYHGWGFDRHYWDNLASLLKEFQCVFYDAGYYKNPSRILNNLDASTTWIGVGHSIGFAKLLENHGELNLSGIVALQSFRYFLGYNKTLNKVRSAALDEMIAEFAKDPLNVIKKFVDTAGAKVEALEKTGTDNDIDFDALQCDLKALKTEYCIPDGIMHLILASENDPIVTLPLIKDNFSNTQYDVKFLECDGHSLGYNSAIEVKKHIIDFVNDY